MPRCFCVGQDEAAMITGIGMEQHPVPDIGCVLGAVFSTSLPEHKRQGISAIQNASANTVGNHVVDEGQPPRSKNSRHILTGPRRACALISGQLSVPEGKWGNGIRERSRLLSDLCLKRIIHLCQAWPANTARPSFPEEMPPLMPVKNCLAVQWLGGPRLWIKCLCR